MAFTSDLQFGSFQPDKGIAKPADKPVEKADKPEVKDTKPAPVPAAPKEGDKHKEVSMPPGLALRAHPPATRITFYALLPRRRPPPDRRTTRARAAG